MVNNPVLIKLIFVSVVGVLTWYEWMWRSNWYQDILKAFAVGFDDSGLVWMCCWMNNWNVNCMYQISMFLEGEGYWWLAVGVDGELLYGWDYLVNCPFNDVVWIVENWTLQLRCWDEGEKLILVVGAMVVKNEGCCWLALDFVKEKWESEWKFISGHLPRSSKSPIK